MRIRPSFVAAITVLFQFAVSAQEFTSPEEIIHKMSEKLSAARFLGYKYEFELSYPGQNRSLKDASDAFIDLKPPDGARFRFQFSGVDRSSTYNGTERFTLDRKEKKIYVENNPAFTSFSDIALMNSPIAFKYALPRIVANKTIQKKVTTRKIGNRDAYVIEFGLPKAIITSEGEIVEIRPNFTNLYRITIDKVTLLPVEVVLTNDENDESIKTTYSSITESPEIPAASSWFYSSYLTDYTLQKKDKLTLIEPRRTAPAFSLDTFGTTSKTSLGQFRGKVVLLEFWIAQCGFCIAAVPKLNNVAARYAHHGLHVISINMYDPAARIEAFKKQNRPLFTILTGGDSIAAAYGVEAFPAIVLIDTEGKVVYSSSGLFEEELTLKIDAVLNK